MKRIMFLIFICLFMISGVKAYDEYKIGDKVTYNDIDFYVIEDSNSDEDTLLLLKAEALSYEDIITYLENIQWDIDLAPLVQKFEDGAGGIAYGLNSNCTIGDYSRCSTDYNKSIIKKLLDVWVEDKLNKNDLGVDLDNNYARLLNKDDLINNLKISLSRTGIESYSIENDDEILDWFYLGMSYWTSIPSDETENDVMIIANMYAPYENTYHGTFRTLAVYSGCNSIFYEVSEVRPVITLNKSALDNNVIPSEDSNDSFDTNNSSDYENSSQYHENKSSNKEFVKVPNTMEKISILCVMIGIILVSVSLVIIFKNRKNNNQ